MLYLQSYWNGRVKRETACDPHSASTPLSNLHPCPHQDLQSNSHCHVDLEGRRKQHYHHSLPFPQPASEAGGKSVEQARSKEEAIQIPVMNQLASTFSTCCCWMVGAPPECLRCPRGLAPAMETEDTSWKLLYPSSSVCFQHKIQASRRSSSRLELLHGQSLCSHIDSES